VSAARCRRRGVGGQVGGQVGEKFPGGEVGGEVDEKILEERSAARLADMSTAEGCHLEESI
jgi:hypothetical protein